MHEATDLAVVFPAANSRGGVERMALYSLEHLGRRARTAFVGRELQATTPPPVTFHQVSVAGRPRLSQGLRFRAGAAEALQRLKPRTTLSWGVACPPGDVQWVQSVHHAWVDRGSAIPVGRLQVPSQARRLMPRHRMLLHLERQYFTSSRPRTVLCTSRREVDDLEHYYRVDPSKMHVLPNPYDGATFNLATRARWRDETRSAMGIEPGQISLLFVVNELHRKGFAVLLDAVARVDDPRLRIDVVGRAPLDPYRQRIASLGLARRVRWHGATPNVERYMAAGDVLVLPTQYEPFGLVIVEALACGLPIVTTSLAGAADAVVDGTNGRLQHDPHDADELAGLLVEAADDGIRSRWTEAAAGSVVDYESTPVMERAAALILG